MVGPHHSCLGGDTLRFNCMEHSSFHSYCSTSVPIFLVLRLALVSTLIYVESLFSFLYFYMFSSLYFVENYLWELFQISWLVLETSKLFYIYSDANGSLFRLWHVPWLVMLGVILHVLVIIVLAWLVSNSWECLMCHCKNHVLFPSSIKLWYSPLMFQLGWLGACLYHVMTTNPVAYCLYDHLVFDL
jgi:hypothetical protein